ncbi:hypothetical protein HCN44_000851 [Aphidius gifuensis]|uniref:RING-type domain-containing protein n=1 Tax=Aphidius gifuensis TaxID=684658 RepID=A0A834XIC6_APHGI|nr:hypothetical protein HCN44_000851 [Aphidius gifuensis]
MSLGVHEDMALTYPFASVVQRMRSWRSAMSFPNAVTYLMMQNSIDTNQWARLRVHNDAAVRTTSINHENENAFIFENPLFLENIPNLITLHITISHLIEPICNDTESVLIVSAVHRDHVIFTFSWGMLDSYSVELLERVMGFIKHEKMHDQQPINIQTNLDWKLKRAIGNVFNETQIATSFHHVVLSILHQAVTDDNININDEDHLSILKKFILLATLPPRSIPEGFTTICRSIPVANQAAFESFIEKFDNIFILGIGPESWPCYRKNELFTDVTFLASASHRDITKLNNNVGQENNHRVIVSPRVGHIISRSKIARLWNLFDNGQITVLKFLAICASIANQYLNLVIFQLEFTAGQFEPMNSNDVIQRHQPILNNPLPEEEQNDLFMALNLDDYQNQLRRRGEAIRNNVVENAGAVNVANAVVENAEVENGPGQNRDEDNAHNLYLQFNINPVNMVAKPCNCLVYCQQCVDTMRHQPHVQHNCPTCNERVQQCVRIYLPSTQNEEDPYDWQCQICRDEPISYMSETCHQLMACNTCIDTVMNLHPARKVRCPFCNVPGDMTRVGCQHNDKN